MNLSTIHTEVRKMVRGGKTERALSGAEGRALRALRRRLDVVDGQISLIVPPAGESWWFAPATIVQTVK